MNGMDSEDDSNHTALDDWKRPLLIAANRAPVTFELDSKGELNFSRGSGGLVTALTGLAAYVPITWVACARTQEDALWHEGDVAMTENSSIHVRFINPDNQTFEEYYNVISNPLLWFLQHSMWDVSRSPVIDQFTWQAWENGYKEVNRQFADAIVDLLPSGVDKPVIMLQDYHLYLAPRYIRDRLHKKQKTSPTIMHFIHIPWPDTNYWRILPPAMRQLIFEGLCAEDLIGFQTEADTANFLRSVETFLPRVSVNHKRKRVWYRNHKTYVHDFPISIDVMELKKTAASEEVAVHRESIQEFLGDHQLILRIDRIEPSKNIIRGFQAFEEMLDLYPEHHGKVNFLAIMVPSRLDLQEYNDYLDECMAAAGRVNARFGNSAWEPIRLFVSEDYPRAVAAMQIYDVLLVNSIADGMNLVAKEGPIVNQRNGVLILSERTGAYQQLASGVLTVSPCDVYSTSQALHQALSLQEEERASWAARLRWLIENEDIQQWTQRQFEIINELGI